MFKTCQDHARNLKLGMYLQTDMQFQKIRLFYQNTLIADTSVFFVKNQNFVTKIIPLFMAIV